MFSSDHGSYLNSYFMAHEINDIGGAGGKGALNKLLEFHFESLLDRLVLKFGIARFHAVGEEPTELSVEPILESYIGCF